MADGVNKSLLGYKSKMYRSHVSTILLHDHKMIEELTDEEETTGEIYKNIIVGTIKLSTSIMMGCITNNLYLIFLQDQPAAVQGAASLGLSVLNVFGTAIFAGLN